MTAHPNPQYGKSARKKRNEQTDSASTSGYRSDCKLCGLSIHDEPAVWSRNPLGLVHTTCFEKTLEGQ